MGMTCFLLLILGLAITAQGQNCSKPVGGPNMSLKDEFILLDTFDDGSKVSFACNIGYETKGGSSQITCTAGNWSPVRLQCQRKSCGSPGEMEHGQIDFSEGVEFGDKIVITCNEGYRFVGKPGPREIYCGDQGWNDRLPVCEAVTCPPPELPPDVTLNTNKEMFSYGEVVQYRCPSGLSVNGSLRASCSEDRTFHPDPPTCVKVQCADIQVPNAEKVQGFKPTYGHQDAVTFKCKPGFKIKGESTVTCDINSQWSPKLPECEEIQCENVEIQNGEKVGVLKPTYGHEDTMTFKCKVGYNMRGESTVTCDMNSQWSPKLPECEIVTCKQPKTVPYGKFSPVQDSYKYKDRVEYSCDQNYELQGAKSVSCSPDGIFTPDPPKCSDTGKDPNGHGHRSHIVWIVIVVVLLVVIVIILIVGYCCGFLPFIKKCSRRRSTDNEARKPDEAVPLS